MSKFATVYYGMPADAGAVKALLVSNGILVFMEDEVVAGMLPQAVGPGGTGPIKVNVAAQDFKKAKDLIKVYYKGEASIPFEDLALRRVPAKTVRRRKPAGRWLDWPACLIILAAVGVVLARNYYAAHFVKYFRHFHLDGRQAMVGTHPLPPDFAGRTFGYRFLYDLRGRLKAVDAVVRGALVYDELLGAARVAVRYGPGSETRTFEDEKGAPAYRDGVRSVRLEFDDARRAGALTNLGEDGRPVEDKHGAARHLWVLDESGRVARSWREDRLGTRVTDSRGVYELRLKYDEAGREVEQSNFGPGGGALENKDGVAVTRWTYDAQGDLVEARFYDAQGQPVRLKPLAGTLDPQALAAASIAVQRMKRDALGDVVQKEFLDADGRPVENADGVAALQFVCDERGNMVERRSFGRDGKPKSSRSAGAAVVKWSYGRDGRALRKRSFDAQGSLVEKKDYGPKFEPPYAPPLGSL